MSKKQNTSRLTALDENRSLSSIDNSAILNFMNSKNSSPVNCSSSSSNTINSSSNNNSK